MGSIQASLGLYFGFFVMWVRCGRMFGIYACFICFSYLAFILGFMLGAIWVLLRFTLGSSLGLYVGLW